MDNALRFFYLGFFLSYDIGLVTRVVSLKLMGVVILSEVVKILSLNRFLGSVYELPFVKSTSHEKVISAKLLMKVSNWDNLVFANVSKLKLVIPC